MVFVDFGVKPDRIVFAAQDQDWARERSAHVSSVPPFEIVPPHESFWNQPLGHRLDPGDDVAVGEM
jgi:hypothetical protein